MAFEFITGTGEILRKQMITYVNVGTSSAPEWEAVGVKVEDSSIEFNPDTETITDIMGVTHTTVNKVEATQSLEPMTIRKESKLAQKLMKEFVYEKDYAKSSQFEVLIVYGWTSDTASGTTFKAEKQTGCTIYPQSLGGSSRVDMPIEITYSNKSEWGSVTDISNPTFTAETA